MSTLLEQKQTKETKRGKRFFILHFAFCIYHSPLPTSAFNLQPSAFPPPVLEARQALGFDGVSPCQKRFSGAGREARPAASRRVGTRAPREYEMSVVVNMYSLAFGCPGYGKIGAANEVVYLAICGERDGGWNGKLLA